MNLFLFIFFQVVPTTIKELNGPEIKTNQYSVTQRVSIVYSTCTYSTVSQILSYMFIILYYIIIAIVIIIIIIIIIILVKLYRFSS